MPPSSNSQHPLDQLKYLFYELQLIVDYHGYRWFICWFTGPAGVILSYRLDRFGYLLFKGAWRLVRVVFFPLFFLLRLMGAQHEIRFSADIGKGLKILHPSLGVVITEHAIAGSHLTLTGGNCIGQRTQLKPGDLVIGDYVNLGANAVVLGPVRIGSYVRIGAGAVVINDAPDGAVLAGVPARVIKQLDLIQ